MSTKPKKKLNQRLSDVAKRPRLTSQGRATDSEVLHLRLRLGLTQEQCADALGLKRRVLAGYERGDFPVKPAYTRLLKLMIRFEVHPSELDARV